mgnify:CR=1 FL=1
MLVRDWMTVNVMSLGVNSSVLDAAEILHEKNIRQFPVIDGDGKLVGIVSRANLLQALAIQRTAAQEAPSTEDRDLRQRFLDVVRG